MSKKHKQHRHQNQGRTKFVMNPTGRGRNDLQGGKKSRKTGMILVAALVVIAAVVAYALNATKSPREGPGPVAPVAAANPPLPTTVVQQPPLLSTSLNGGLIASGSGPRIQFATPVHDFGQIKGGDVVGRIDEVQPENEIQEGLPPACGHQPGPGGVKPACQDAQSQACSGNAYGGHDEPSC